MVNLQEKGNMAREKIQELEWQFKVIATTSQGPSRGQEGMIYHVDRPWVQLPLESEFCQIKQQRRSHRAAQQVSKRQDQTETKTDELLIRTSDLRPDSLDHPGNEHSYLVHDTSYPYNMSTSTTDVASTPSINYGLSTANMVFLPSFPNPIFPDNTGITNLDYYNKDHPPSRFSWPDPIPSPPASMCHGDPTSFHHLEFPEDITMASTSDFNFNPGYQELPTDADIQILTNDRDIPEVVDVFGWDNADTTFIAGGPNIPHYLPTGSTHSTCTSTSTTPSITTNMAFHSFNKSYFNSMPQTETYPSHFGMNYGFHVDSESSGFFFDGSLNSSQGHAKNPCT